MNEQQMVARRLLSMLDLTSLNDTDDADTITELCRRALTTCGPVAAVCVLPPFVSLARQCLDTADQQLVKVVTVSNFPAGDVDLVAATDTTAAAVAAGADEVDVVLPWRAFMAGDAMVAEELVRASVRACADKARLKVIIESGRLAAPAFIQQACEICLDAGVDFIKTSTGRESPGATPEAVRLIAEVLKDSGSSCGIKVSGGVRDVRDAAAYLAIADEVMGEEWAKPERFRVGASSLLDSLLSIIDAPSGAD